MVWGICEWRKLPFGLAVLLVGGVAESQPRPPTGSHLAQFFSPVNNGSPISCASALLPNDKFDEGLRWWALGYWSGQNAANSALVGSQTDGNGIIAEIEKRAGSNRPFST